MKGCAGNLWGRRETSRGQDKDYLGIQLPGVYAALVLKLTVLMMSERKSTDLKFRLGRADPGD